MVLNSWLAAMRGQGASRHKGRRRQKRSMTNAAAVCQMERLEPRVMLSASPVGVELQVNTTVVGNQLTDGNGGAIAMDASGNFVVTWTSDGQDGSLGGVYAQRFNALGVAQGAEFLVNTTVAGDQSDAAVAMDAAGNFVITWTSNGQDGDGDGVYAQLYTALGVTVGSEILVNTTTTGDQNDSAVAMHASGAFVVTWTSSGQDGDLGGIYAQQFSALGAAVGTETLVNTTTTGDQTNSAVALDALGNGVVTWTSSGTDGDLGGIYAQQFNALGVAQGSEILVNTVSAGDQSEATVAMSATGEFVVAWTSAGQDGDGDGVFAQKFDALGVAVGPEFQVNTTVAGDQNGVAVAVDAAGDLVFTWTSDGQDGNLTGVYAQLYTAAGAALGGEVLVNTTTAGAQEDASVAANAAGGFVVAYTSGGLDTDGQGVFAQLFQLTPVVTGTGGLVYTENDAATAIDAGITLTDDDNATLASATVTITNFVAAEDQLAFINDGVTMGNVAVTSNVGGQLTLTSAGATATTAEWEAALQAVTYFNSSDDPNVTQRVVVIVVNDGSADSDPLSTTIDILAENDAPVLSGIEPLALPYAPNSAAVVITSSLQLTDADTATINGATIQITGEYQNGADLLAFTDTALITGNWNAATGTLTLTGVDTVANYELALQSVTYVSTSLSPVARTVSFQVTDGVDVSNIATRDIGGELQLDGTVLNVYGTIDPDTITVTEGASLVVVRNGETFTYSPESVTAINIYGSASNDIIEINSLASDKGLQVFGEGGNDTIRVSSEVTADATLDGGDGNDLLLGGSGFDTLLGGLGNDWLDGGDGYDMLIGGVGNDVYAFDDTLINQIDTVVEQVDEGTDLLHFASLETAVTANLTSDTSLATMAHRIVQTGNVGQAANFENVNGGSANDTITGNAVNNVVYGNGGNDTIHGGDANDQLDGGDGNDLLNGGLGADVLVGGLGNDYLRGNAGNDLLDGGDGFNTLVGGVGDDVYRFSNATVNQIDTIVELVGEGVDTLDFASLATAVTVNLTSDTSLATMAQRIVQTGAAGQAANLENVIGGLANDHITGNAASNLLWGHDGTDTLIGGDGNDIVLGGAGNDILKGISGRDLLIGGIGADLLQTGVDGSVMLSGSFDFESNVNILDALLLEWIQVTSYQSRVDHLEGLAGGANAGQYLDINTVTNDADADYLQGGSGQDFYLASSAQDVLTAQAFDEIFTHIDTWV